MSRRYPTRSNRASSIDTSEQTNNSDLYVQLDGTPPSPIHMSQPSSLPSEISQPLRRSLRNPPVTSQTTLTLPSNPSQSIPSQSSSVPILSAPPEQKEDDDVATQVLIQDEDARTESQPVRRSTRISTISSSVADEKEPEPSGDDFILDKIWGRYELLGKVYYEIQWKGYDMRYNTLQPKEDLGNAKAALREFASETRGGQSSVLKPTGTQSIGNNAKIGEIVDMLQRHTEEESIEEMQIHAQNWLDYIETFNPEQIALGIAIVQGWEWCVLKKFKAQANQMLQLMQAELEYTGPGFSLFEARANQMPKPRMDLTQESVLEDEEKLPEEKKQQPKKKQKAPQRETEGWPWLARRQELAFEVKYKSVDLSSTRKITGRNGKYKLYEWDIETADPSVLNNGRLHSDLQKLKDIQNEQKSPVLIELDEKHYFCDRIAFIDLEVHVLGDLHKLSQMCAVSLDGSRIMNKYIRNFPDPYLAKNWQQLVVDGYVDIEPSDDPKLAVSFADAIKSLCATFDSGTLFLFKATGDYNWIIDNFRNQIRVDGIGEAIAVFCERQFRFVSMDDLFRRDELPAKIRAGGMKLEDLYKKMFVKSLILNTAMKTFLYNHDVQEQVSNSFREGATWGYIDPSFNYPMGSAECVDIWYWPNQNLLPVFHTAHSDALITRNVAVAMLYYFLNAYAYLAERGVEASPENFELVWDEIMTCFVCQTAAFRKAHLGCCSSTAAALLFWIVTQDQDKIQHTRYSPLAIAFSYLSSSNEPGSVGRPQIYAAKPKNPPVVTSPEVAPALFDAAGPQDDSKTDSLPNELVYSIQPYFNKRRLKVRKPELADANARKEVLKYLILQANRKLEGDGSKLPKQFRFDRSDFENFQEMSQDIAEKKNANTEPQPNAIISMESKRFPKTFTLHVAGCRYTGYQGVDGVQRPASEQNLLIIPWYSNPQLSFRLRFCKECKRFSANESILTPLYNPRVVIQKDETQKKEQSQVLNKRFDQLLDIVATQVKKEPNSQQPQVIQLQAPPVVVNYQGPETRSRSNNNQLQPLAARPPRLVGLRQTDARNRNLQIFNRGQ